MKKYILKMICFMLFKIIRHIQDNIVDYLPLIEKVMGFDNVVSLLNNFGNIYINPRILRHFGAQIGKFNRIHSPLIIHNADNDFANLTVGNNCHIGRDVFIDLAEKIEIDNNVTISMRCMIITHLDVGDSSLKDTGYPRKTGPVTIGENVYIGCGVTVLHGVTIGKNSMIGAGAIVVNDIPANSIAIGMPAKVIRKIDGSSEK